MSFAPHLALHGGIENISWPTLASFSILSTAVYHLSAPRVLIPGDGWLPLPSGHTLLALPHVLHTCSTLHESPVPVEVTQTVSCETVSALLISPSLGTSIASCCKTLEKLIISLLSKYPIKGRTSMSHTLVLEKCSFCLLHGSCDCRWALKILVTWPFYPKFKW